MGWKFLQAFVKGGFGKGFFRYLSWGGGNFFILALPSGGGNEDYLLNF